MEAAQNDAEFMVLDGMRKRSGYVKKLEGVFQAIDKSGRGVLTEARLNDILSNPSVKVYFQSLGVDLHEGTVGACCAGSATHAHCTIAAFI